MKQFYTYLHCKPDGTPFYVGKGMGRRGYSLVPRNSYHGNIIAKYGKDNIDILVFPQESEDAAFKTEKLWIDRLRAEGYVLTNMTDGGEGQCGVVLSDDEKKKISEILRGNKRNLGNKASLETRAKISAAVKGRKASNETKAKLSVASTGRNVGRKASNETKAKISASLKGRSSELMKSKWNDPEYRARMSDAHKGKKVSKETREKLSKAMFVRHDNPEVRKKISSALIGNTHTKGHKLTDEHRAKVSESSKKMWSDPEVRKKILAGNKRFRETQRPDGVVPNIQGA